MKKFIALYLYTGNGPFQAPDSSPEEQAEGLKPWFAWKEKYGDQVVDFGAPVFGPRQSSGGAWSGVDQQVTGYSIVAAKDAHAAQEMFAGHPIFHYPEHAVQISEFAPM